MQQEKERMQIISIGLQRMEEREEPTMGKRERTID